MSKRSLNTVDDFLKEDEKDGFENFEKNKKHKRFDDEVGRKRNRKKTIKDLKK